MAYVGVYDPNRVYWGNLDGYNQPREGGPDIVSFQGALWEAKQWLIDVNPMLDAPGDDGVWKLVPGTTPKFVEVAPDAPTGVTAGEVTDDSITLFWNPADVQGIGTVSSYNIYLNGVKVGTSATTSFTVQGLEANTDYTFEVDAVNQQGPSGRSTFSTSTEDVQVENGKYFSPYIDMTHPDTNLIDLARDSDISDFTLAFMQSNNDILDDETGFLTPGEVPELAWGGLSRTTLPTGVIIDQIKQVQDNGGTITISFGGYTGRDPAVVCAQWSDYLQTAAGGSMTKAAADQKAADHFQTMLQGVIDTYGVNHLDFDVENDVWNFDETTKYAGVDDADANHIRNMAINQLRADNPDLHISLTVATLPDGVSDEPSDPVAGGGVSGSGDVEAMLELIKADGVVFDVVNIMAMDYFDGAANPDMGDNAISAAIAMHELLQRLGLDAKVGVTPMIGQNDAYNDVTHGNEVFDHSDAEDLVEFFASTPWIAGLGAWQLTRDRFLEEDDLGKPPEHDNTGLAQDDFEFTRILELISRWRETGAAGDDEIQGTATANALSGLDGADSLLGAGGNDTLNGGPGNDFLDGGDGRDRADYSTAGSRVTVDLRIPGQQATIGGGRDTLTNIEEVDGSAYHDTLRGNDNSNRLAGGEGNDSLYGFGGVDNLRGEAGHDLANGGAGNDVLDGAAGNDTLQGGADNDTLGSGQGMDNLSGDAGDDRLDGGVSRDTIDGGQGNDTIFGGTSGDQLTGGIGADRFVYRAVEESPSNGVDRIMDFDAQDVIDLSAIDAIEGTGANDAFTFVGALTGVAGQAMLVYRANTNLTKLYADTDGDGVTDLQIQATGHLTADDFVA